jgi:hypothetical protein
MTASVYEASMRSREARLEPKARPFDVECPMCGNKEPHCWDLTRDERLPDGIWHIARIKRAKKAK